MSDMPQEIALFQKVKNEAARKRLNIKAAFFWCTSKKESLALSRMALAMDEAGFDDEDFARPIRVNLPIVDDLPEEGVFDTAFCDRYQLGDDGMTFGLIPGAAPITPAGEKIVEGTDTTIVDGVDTSTGEIVDKTTFDSVGNSANDDLDIDENDDEDTRYPIVQMSFRKQLLAQFTSDALRYHLTQAEHKEVVGLEMDTDNGYVQNLILAAESVDKIKKLDMPFLWKYTKAVRDVFDTEKRHDLSLVLQFTKIWAETSHIDRGLLVKEWGKGNRVSEINRTPSGANAVGGNHTDRLTPLTVLGLEYEICLGLIAREQEFDIYKIPLTVEFLANNMMNKMENKEFMATRELFVSMPGGRDYSRACIIATVKTTPEGLWEDHVKHREYLNRVMTETDHAHPDELIVDIACGRSSMPMPMAPVKSGMSEPGQSEKEDDLTFDASALMQNSATHGAKKAAETTSNVQVQETDSNEKQAGDALHTGESDLGTGEESNTGQQADVNQNTDSVNQNSDSVNHIEPKSPEVVPEPQPVWPPHFEPGRYENLPNEVYHSANGISSTQLKDVRISPMYYYGRHIAKTIPREQNDAMLRGTIIHSYVLEPEKFESEFAVPEEVPAEVVSTSGDLVSIIKEYNAGLPSLATPDDLKAYIEELNKTLTPPLSLSGSADETANLYMSLPVDFQRIPDGTKHTASAQKACIKEYNASLQPLLKVSGTREQLLDQIATIDPEYAEKERAKFIPYNVSGTKEQLTEIVRAIRPDVVTADDWHQQQEEASQGKTMISLDMYAQAKNISAALQAHPSASRLLTHPSRQSEVSYFGFDEETGLEIRVRPDLEITLPHARIGGDLKTTSLGYVKQDDLKARLHREIISRDYHLSAAMYCDTAELDQFFWIFVNRDEGYHWIAVVEASPDLLELGRKEYRRALRTINDCTMSGNWPAPITEDYTDELNDFDLRRLEALDSL